MPFLSAYLKQISISCQGIDSLPFPPPKIFTNALLSNPDITSLIRDTEAHERALFFRPRPAPSPTRTNNPPEPDPPPPKPSSRRQTVFNVAAGEARRNTAVAAVLGGDLHAQITRRGQGQGQGQGNGQAGDVDIEVLLHGAEKLCAVYPLPGALERIPAQRQKYAQQSGTLAYYENKVAEQQGALERVNMERSWDEEGEGEEEKEEDGGEGLLGDVGMTEEDLRQEEAEVRALEKKKRLLQARLKALNSDLGGLLDI